MRLFEIALDARNPAPYFAARAAPRKGLCAPSFRMNIHEYQAKALFDKFGVATPRGIAATSGTEALTAAKSLGTTQFVVKAQVHAGGRGKGTFKNGFQGGVHLVDSPEKAQETAEKMLGEVLVTHQTGEDGKLVRQVLIAETIDIEKEYYFAILVDRETERPSIIASREGGVEIEEVAEKHPEKIFKEFVHPTMGLQPYQARKLANQLGFTGKQIRKASSLFLAMYKLFIECDCSMVEVNPLVLTPDGDVLALDAKFGFDDNALFRHPDIAAMRDPEEEDPREVEASKFDLNYIGLDGNIGCMVNGAGLAMSTMDIIKTCGGDPANFLDVGGGATESQVKEAFRILLGDPKVKAILVNIFGGIMQCDVIAQGIINAAKTVDLNIPLIVRLEGTNVEAGRALLNESGLALITAETLADAAQKAVDSVSAA